MALIAGYVHLLASAVLVGKVVLLSFVVTPVLAKHLNREQFAKVVRALFPPYYALGAGAAVVGLLSLGSISLVGKLDARVFGACAMWLLILIAEMYCRSRLTPRSNTMRDRLLELEQRGEQDLVLLSAWTRLHQRSVMLNSLVMIAGLCVLARGMGFQ